MSIFSNIDDKLIKLSIRLNATLTKDRPSYPEALRTFEERRIDWIDNGINRAIIIQPTFELSGVNSEIWNFLNIAWINDLSVHPRPNWQKFLVEKKPFKLIEKNIDELLKTSENKLTNIKMTDLK
ncbi:MAG: hypothetical protein CMC14_00670 [Flavobacteriaceae bacterium]|nr:hypothetical protein [Flavobacteriaceae bacterium]|tara:strand:+ start:2223 stop:2597 length:375 start_codon:yes stop_codon:yes gene_type:complete